MVFSFGSKQKLYAEVVRGAVEKIGAGAAELPGPASLERLATLTR